jgi:cytochrome P450
MPCDDEGGAVPERQHYDLHSKAFFSDPYPVYRAMREHDPVHQEPDTGAWLLTRHDDVAQLLRHPRVSADRTAPLYPADTHWIAEEAAALRRFMAPWLIFLDGAEHSRVRSVLNRSFTPRSIAALRPVVQRMVDEAISGLRAADQPDLMRDLCLPVPARVVGHLLGLPPEDLPGFQQSVNAVFQFAGQQGDVKLLIRRAHRATRDLNAYFRELIAEKRRTRGDDLLSLMVTADEEGRFLTEQELIGNCALLLVAGHETTTHAIGNGVIALLRHPDQLHLLRERPELIGSAVEEMLRYDSPTGWAGRLVLDDIEIGGRRIEKGAIVYAVGHAANRDPAVHQDPDRFDITRQGPRHLAFGYGPHTCLGAALARLEAEVAISTLLREFPGLAPAVDEYDWISNYAQRGVSSLPVTLFS